VVETKWLENKHALLFEKLQNKPFTKEETRSF